MQSRLSINADFKLLILLFQLLRVKQLNVKFGLDTLLQAIITGSRYNTTQYNNI